MKYVVCLFVVFLPLMKAVAQDCAANKPATTPTTQFKFNNDGTVLDTKTGLTWMRCADGQSWGDGHCTIDFKRSSHAEASGVVKVVNKKGYAGHKDWRLPTQKELTSIVEQQCFSPAINLTVFPEAPVTGYWAIETDPAYKRGALLVHFYDGHGYMSKNTEQWALRLVR